MNGKDHTGANLIYTPTSNSNNERNAKMNKYPLKLTYTAKSAIWGGDLLSEKWGKRSEDANIAETWELTVREKEMAEIINGEGAGMTLSQYFEAAGYDVVSKTYKKGDRFPLLVKLIDAADKLSVQVHPDDGYAGEVENDSGKTEMWYIVDAKDGAEIIYGLGDGIDNEGFRRAFAEGRIDSAMKKIKVHAGECYFIPAGMVHAIGAGILIAEIQQNSDLTYRVYDYDRVGADGKLRELHTKKALDVIRPYTADEIDSIRYSEGKDKTLLANNKYFKVKKLEISEKAELCVKDNSFMSILCIGGNGIIRHGTENYKIVKGDSYFCPAGMGDITISGSLTIICSEL